MLLSNMELLATAPGGVAKLRELILTLAVQGKLVPQDPADEPAGVLLQKIRAEKDRLIAEGKIKREKPLAVIAEEEKPFELPKGWEWVHLAALAEQITKGTTPTTFGHSYTPEGVNFVKIENLDRGRLNLAQMTDFISPETHEIMSRSQLSAGDVLFSIAGTIGKTAVVLDADLPANTNQALAIIKGAAKHVNQRFLLLALDSFVSNKVKNKNLSVNR
jgi:type I restriction enzyme, S subunit